MSHLVDHDEMNYSVPDYDLSTQTVRTSLMAQRSENLKQLQTVNFAIPRSRNGLVSDINFCGTLEFTSSGASTTNAARIIGSYFTLIRSQLLKMNGTPVSNIQNSGPLYNALMNLTFSKSQKSSSSAYLGTNENIPDSLVGKIFNKTPLYDPTVAGSGGYETTKMEFMIPLGSLLGDDQTLIIDSVTVELSIVLESLDNIMEQRVAGIVTDYTVNDARLVYNLTTLSDKNFSDFIGLNTTDNILQYNTSTWVHSSNTIPQGTKGTVHLNFPVSVNNCQGALLLFQPTNAALANISSVFPVFSSLQFDLGGGKYYPMLPHDLTKNASRLLYETKYFAGEHKSNCMDMNNFMRSDTATDYTKAYVDFTTAIGSSYSTDTTRGTGMAYLWIPFSAFPDISHKVLRSGVVIDRQATLKMILDRPVSVNYNVQCYFYCSQRIVHDLQTNIVTNDV